ncbi:MAG: Hsp70 family protein, partial [Clostridia bacterium]|nr:Hsp70 family protein [Clostridia bacterium]
VEIHVLQGERPMAADNKTIGKFRLKGIKMAPAGVPQIEVTFDIDTNGILRVSAKDMDTGKEQGITITANDKMSDAEINAAIRDAEQYAAQDSVRRDALNIGHEAQQLMNDVEKALDEKGKQLDKAEKKQIKDEVNALRKLVFRKQPDKMEESDLNAVRAGMESLCQASSHLMSL